jgi:subtilisin family serine protease
MGICKRYSVLVSTFIVGVSFFCMSSVHASFAMHDPLAEQWAFEDIGAYTAWEDTSGSRDVIVALIDNGFDTFHPDLRKNVWKNVDEISDNNIDDDKNGYIDDVWGWSFIPVDSNHNGIIDAGESLGTNDPRPKVLGMSESVLEGESIHHGTVVAGLIGAVGGNGKGISGIAPNVQLMNIQMVDETGYGTFELLDKAIRYAVDNGADIINISMIGDKHDFIESSISYAYDNGVVVVAAAGNTAVDLNVNPLHPICADDTSLTQRILGVSSISEDHRLSYFSNTGSQCINITAPGEYITSTIRFSPKNGLTEKYRSGWSGTSFAAPLVSGAAALIKAIQPTWGPDSIYKAILSTVHHTPNEDEEGYANLFGSGLLQVDRAVQYALDRVVSRRILSSLLFLSPSDGQTQEAIDNRKNTVTINNNLEGVDDVVAYTDNNKVQYITSKWLSDSERTITIYSEVWKELSSFVISASGALEFAVADVTGDDLLDIVVAPKYADDQMFSVYTFSGEFQEEYSFSGLHNGVSMAITQDGKILTFGEQNEKMVVNIFDHAFDAPNASITIGSLEKKGSIAVGDVDGDQQDEILLGGATGERPLVSIYEMDGKLRRTFSVFDGYQGGFSIDSADYDSDGKDDILTVPYRNEQSARVWSGKSKKLAQWKLFKGKSLKDIITLPQY